MVSESIVDLKMNENTGNLECIIAMQLIPVPKFVIKFYSAAQIKSDAALQRAIDLYRSPIKQWSKPLQHALEAMQATEDIKTEAKRKLKYLNDLTERIEYEKVTLQNIITPPVAESEEIC